ncbi:MAG: ABC-2 family transporter protein [Treponema sp.]|nr:ABC-2 family transporter protein [Treponema sp.]MCL2251845.1 ABC-2 family transporter protein [Treponema sp.]
MKRYLTIYIECIKTAMARALTYRLNFVLSLLITIGYNALFPLVSILIYRSGASFPGWNFYEVLLMQSIFILSQGFASIMFNNVLWTTMYHIREGSFEIVLLKPLNPLFYLIASNFDPESVGLIIGGIVLFVFSLMQTEIANFVCTSAAAIPQFLLLFTAGFAVMAGINLIMAATSFKWVGNSRIPEIFDTVLTFGKYPINIFPAAIKGIVTYIIPVGMIGFYPASALLCRLEPTVLFAVIPCMLFMFLGIWLYQFMVRLYEGVGG